MVMMMSRIVPESHAEPVLQPVALAAQQTFLTSPSQQGREHPIEVDRLASALELEPPPAPLNEWMVRIVKIIELCSRHRMLDVGPVQKDDSPAVERQEAIPKRLLHGEPCLVPGSGVQVVAQDTVRVDRSYLVKAVSRAFGNFVQQLEAGDKALPVLCNPLRYV